MEIQGGCYCGGLRYEATGDPLFKGQCHCRECQYISGGHPNVVVAMPESGFSYTMGSPKQFRRSDLEKPVTRVKEGISKADAEAIVKKLIDAGAKAEYK